MIQIRGILKEINSLLNSKIPKIEDIKVENIVIGLGYTGVKLDNGKAGVCHTLLSETNPRCCSILNQAGTLAGGNALHFLKMTESWDMIERVIGVATINALSQIVFESNLEDYSIEQRNLIDVIRINKDDTVALVGLIRPFVPVFKSKSRKLYIFERGAQREKNILPDTASEDIIPKADVIVITGSSLANGTINRLLTLSENARTVALVGPTVSCIPDPLFNKGVDYVAGIRIDDADLAMQIIGEGGGTRQLKTAGEFLTFKVN